MRVDTARKLFAGVRIDGRMREQLEKCPSRDRVYFESADGRYLTVLRGGDDTYVGKLLDPALPLNGIDDVRRNIWSLLQRVCPGRRDESEVKLFALDDADVEPTFSASGHKRPFGTGSDPGSGRPGGPNGPDRLGDRFGERHGDRHGDRLTDGPKGPTREPNEDDYY